MKRESRWSTFCPWSTLMLYCCRDPRAFRKSSERSPSVAVQDEVGVGAAEELEEEEVESEDEPSRFSASATTDERLICVLETGAGEVLFGIAPFDGTESVREELGERRERIVPPAIGDGSGEKVFLRWRM